MTYAERDAKRLIAIAVATQNANRKAAKAAAAMGATSDYVTALRTTGWPVR